VIFLFPLFFQNFKERDRENRETMLRLLILCTLVGLAIGMRSPSGRRPGEPNIAASKTKASGAGPPQITPSGQPLAPVVALDFSKAIGAQAPLGLWDPLGLLKDADQERFDRLRRVELKHGRISMLAVLGHLVTTSGYRLDGALGLEGTEFVAFADIDNGLAALVGPHAMPYAGLVQLIIFIGGIDLAFTNYAEKSVSDKCDEIMTLGFGWGNYTKRLKQSIELSNGRAAQMGILALMVHEMLDNDPYIINTLLGVPVKFNVH